MEPWEATETQFDASAFSGRVRLFPLPNVVLYPHVMQPLHIFEERYREMLDDALATDQLITMAVLKPGWETDYESRPPISEFACLGKVVAHHKMDDGRSNVLLLGVQRVKLVTELDPLRSFRQARVELLEDCCDFASAYDGKLMQEKLLAAFRTHLPCTNEIPEQLEAMLSNQLPLGLLTDLAAYALPLSSEIKLQLLGECRVKNRAEILLREVRQLTVAAATPKATKRPFPPTFSDN